MFCVGRHIVRDLATCTRAAAMPAAVVTVSAPEVAEPAPPAITPAPFDVAPPAPARQPATASPTERLNRAPAGTTPGG